MHYSWRLHNDIEDWVYFNLVIVVVIAMLLSFGCISQFNWAYIWFLFIDIALNSLFFRFEIPTLFPCQHTVCVGCVRRIAKDNEKSLLCPVCRVDATNGQLIPNFTLHELLDITARHTCLETGEPVSSGGDGQQVRLPSFYLLLHLRCIYASCPLMLFISATMMYHLLAHNIYHVPCSFYIGTSIDFSRTKVHVPSHTHSSLLDSQSYQLRITYTLIPTVKS